MPIRFILGSLYPLWQNNISKINLDVQELLYENTSLAKLLFTVHLTDRENPWILARFPEIEMHVVVQWPPSDGDYNNLLQSMKIPL